MELKVLATLLIVFVTFSHAMPEVPQGTPEQDCVIDFATCSTDLEKAVKDLVNPDPTVVCEALKKATTCFDDVANKCKDIIKPAALFAKAVSGTLDAVCNEKNPLYQKIKTTEQCIKDHTVELQEKCIKPPPKSDTPSKDAQCKMIKEAVACLPNEMGKLCKDDAKFVGDELIKIWQPLIKDQCGGAGAITSFLALILAALLAVFKMNSQSI